MWANLLKNLCQKRKNFAQFMEIIWNITYFFLEKRFRPKVFVWTLRIQFWSLRWKLVDTKPKLCRSKFDNDKKNNFITIYSPKMFQWRTTQSWQQRLKIINKMPKCFHPMTRNDQKDKISWKKTFSFKMFLWTFRLQFWKSRRNLSDKKMKHFHLSSEFVPKE